MHVQSTILSIQQEMAEETEQVRLITKIIDICSHDQECSLKKEDMVEFVEEQLNSEARNVIMGMKEFLGESLKLTIKKNSVFLENESKESFTRAAQLLKDYRDFLIMLGRIRHGEVQFLQLYQFCKDLQDTKSSIRWTNECDTTFIEELITLGRNQLNLVESFIRDMNPPLNMTVYETKVGKTVLNAIMESLTNIGQKENPQIVSFASFIAKSMKQQNIQFGSNSNDIISLLQCGVSEIKLEQMLQTDDLFSDEKKECLNLFVDPSRKVEIPIIENEEINHEIKQNVLKESDERCKVSSPNFQIIFQLSNPNFIGTMIAKDDQFNGYLLPQGEPCCENFRWMIFQTQTEQWSPMILTDDESNQINNQRKKNDIFEILINSTKLKVNARKNRVSEMMFERASTIESSLTYGILYWVPKFKRGMHQTMQITDKGFASAHQTEDDTFTVNGQFKDFFSGQASERLVKTQIETQFDYFHELIRYTGIQNLRYCVNGEHIIVSDPVTIQEVKQWKQVELPQLVAESFTDSRAVDSHESQSIQLSGVPPIVYQQIQEICAKQRDTECHIAYNDGSLVLKNLRRNEDLVSKYVKYLIKMAEESAKHKELLIQIDKEDFQKVKNITDLQYPSVILQKVSNEKAKIKGDKSVVKAILSAIEEEKKKEFFVDNFDLLETFKADNETRFRKLTEKLEFKEQSGNSFSVTGVELQVANFCAQFNQFCKEYLHDNLMKEKRVIRLEGESHNRCLFYAVLSGIPDISMRAEGEDLLIETNFDRWQQVSELINKQIVSKKMKDILYDKESQFRLKYYSDSIRWGFEKRLMREVKSIGTQMSRFNLQVDLLCEDPTQYAFRISRASAQEKQCFQRVKDLLFKRLKDYNDIFKQMRNTNMTVQQIVKPIASLSYEEKDINKEVVELKKLYSQKVHKLVQSIFDESHKELLKSFSTFLKQGNIEQRYEFDFRSKFRQSLQKQNQGVFIEYLDQKMKSAVKGLKLNKKTVEHYQYEINQIMLNEALSQDEHLKSKTLHKEQVKNFVLRVRLLLATFFNIQLPIVDKLPQFSQLIRNEKNIIVKVGTGSGKSTILPPFLVGLGFKKVIVTQPRRLPCREIYHRIQKTHSPSAVGFSYSGHKEDTSNPLQFTTDGLLNTILSRSPELVKDIDVIMLDQIHERTKSIDLILSKIPQLRQLNPNLKVILCSATIDDAVIKIIDPSAKCGRFEVNVNSYPVKQHKIEKQSILDCANRLSADLKNNEKMLIFLPGIDDTLKAVERFRTVYNKQAYPLHGSQKSSEQDNILKVGQIFIATSIAETSLTFPGLKYVIDSRKTRITIFDENIGIFITKEIPASRSSVAQRRGRVGRDGPGQYYYEQIVQTSTEPILEHNMTELMRIDLTNVVFELLIKYGRVEDCKGVLKKLISSSNVDSKISFSVSKLLRLQVINSRCVLSVDGKKMAKFGSLGNVRYNYALFKSLSRGCSYNIVVVVAFLMHGAKIIDKVISAIPSSYRHPSGDIMTVSSYFTDMCEKMRMTSIRFQDVESELRKHHSIASTPYFPTLLKVFQQIKRFTTDINSDIEISADWGKVCECFQGFPEDVYFHEFSLSGKKGNYDKLMPGMKYTINTKDDHKIHYQLNRTSLIYQKDQTKLPSVILSLSNFCNTNEDGILSMCSVLSEYDDPEIEIVYKSIEKDKLDDIQLIDEKNIISNMDFDGSVTREWPSLNIKKRFQHGKTYFGSVIEQLRNQTININLGKQLEKEIKRLSISAQRASNLQFLLEQINLLDIFGGIKYEFENLYNVEIKLPFNNEKIVRIKGANNWVANQIYERFLGFIKWFVRCQNISSEDKKVQPKLLNPKKLDKVFREEIIRRINMIVDSEIPYHTVKSWTFSTLMPYSPRTMRMIAVCWVLVNKFDCIVKGGFIRDWVIRNSDKVPAHNLDQLLQRNNANGHMQVIDDKNVSPLDIDAELPLQRLFDTRKFIQEIRKLGISIEFSNPRESNDGGDFWRRHVIFDKSSATGAFTADLIEPCCYITHDSCDFDVNLFYVLKDWKGALGLKIPLKLKPIELNHQQKNVSIEDLVKDCANMKMRQLKQSGDMKYRVNKFISRGWTIDPVLYEPNIYRTRVTNEMSWDRQKFQQQFPQFKQNLPNAKIREVISIKNTDWDNCYDASRRWILNETNSANQIFLFHGSKEVGIKGILKNGFDSRYFSKDGLYGRGAYFADDASKANTYSGQFADPPNYRCMFICKVALGKQEQCTQFARGKLGPSPGFHSIFGTAGDHREYIIDRCGQAKPLFLIKYSK